MVTIRRGAGNVNAAASLMNSMFAVQQQRRAQAGEERRATEFKQSLQDRSQKERDIALLAKQQGVDPALLRQQDIREGEQTLALGDQSMAVTDQQMALTEQEMVAASQDRTRAAVRNLHDFVKQGVDAGIPPSDRLLQLSPVVLQAFGITEDIAGELRAAADKDPKGFLAAVETLNRPDPTQARGSETRPISVFDTEMGTERFASAAEINANPARFREPDPKFRPVVQDGVVIALTPEGGGVANDVSGAVATASGRVAEETAVGREVGNRRGAYAANMQPFDPRTSFQFHQVADQAAGRFDDSIQRVERLIPQTSLATSGISSILNAVPGTPMANFAGELKVLESRAFMTEVNRLREQAQAAGAQGTGLGQITEREITALEVAEENIKNSFTPEALRGSLEAYKIALTKARDAIEAERKFLESQDILQPKSALQPSQAGGTQTSAAQFDAETQAILDLYTTGAQ